MSYRTKTGGVTEMGFRSAFGHRVKLDSERVMGRKGCMAVDRAGAPSGRSCLAEDIARYPCTRGRRSEEPRADRQVTFPDPQDSMAFVLMDIVTYLPPKRAPTVSGTWDTEPLDCRDGALGNAKALDSETTIVTKQRRIQDSNLWSPLRNSPPFQDGAMGRSANSPYRRDAAEADQGSYKAPAA